MLEIQEVINQYLDEVSEQFYSGHAIEHAYRPALKQLISSFEDTIAVNDPKHSAHGAPDFVFLKRSNDKIIKGYAEAKDITVSLDKTEKTDQMERYGGYANLFLTDYLEFRFFKNGEKYQTISLGHVEDGKLYKTPENGERLIRELQSFLDLPPEKIRRGKRLAQIMGGKARRIRDNVEQYLKDEEIKSDELENMYEMMKKLLVHDMTKEKFADMYAQTLVYGLFIARYGDTTPDNFSRQEARDLVPDSNPFLRHFFDHIVGSNFDVRLGYIVDELCEIFSVSNVQEIVHKHLRIADNTTDVKDPIIHFYEDFLQEYDPAERKKMGAYYTPIPVVKFIVKQVDKILKEEFGIAKGIASSETIDYEVEVGQDMRTDKRKKAHTKQILTLPRVQILDPAVGTATFLNETIKFVHNEFKGQEGRWPAYVNDNLIKRLHGFELMMAPYTIAHLKLGMTLRETGVKKLNDRLGVYLTNTLEEGIPNQTDLFSNFGLAGVVSDESRHAAEIKSDRPVMVIIGNPPYSGESSNKTKYAASLVDKYKVEPGGQQKLQERNPKWLNDDYVKFIAFAEDMINKNGEGIIGMITAHGYLDNPTFRGMRWHLAKTFEKIYIVDLHGNGNRKEAALDGGKDENVFDIMQGVSIIIAVKHKSREVDLAEVYHMDLFGTRKSKFSYLADSNSTWNKLSLDTKNIFFIPKNTRGKEEYDKGIESDKIFNLKSVSVVTSADKTLINSSKSELIKNLYNSKNSGGSKKIDQRLENVLIDEAKIVRTAYQPFDNRYIYYEPRVIERPRHEVMKHFLAGDNTGILLRSSVDYAHYGLSFMVDTISVLGNLGDFSSLPIVAPLYLYNDDGTRTPNFDMDVLKKLAVNLASAPKPEDVLDYIYAKLHSPKYREKYKEFLKIDFPRVPIPKSDDEFIRLSGLGKQLRELHLMKSPLLDKCDTIYPIPGDNIVEKIEFIPQFSEAFWNNNPKNANYKDISAVKINDAQFFGNIPEPAWNFYIGGHQPAQKWLKDRKGRKLSDQDIEHYQKIIKILIETDKIMKEIG